MTQQAGVTVSHTFSLATLRKLVSDTAHQPATSPVVITVNLGVELQGKATIRIANSKEGN